MVKGRYEIMAEDELNSHSVMLDIKDAEKKRAFSKSDSLKRSLLRVRISKIIKKWGIMMIIILIVLLYAASRLRL